MALIGKIRAKSGLLVAMIGIALLAFILNDYQSLFGIGEGEYGIGLVFGEKVDPASYSIASAKFLEQERNQAAQNNNRGLLQWLSATSRSCSIPAFRT
mgnify:CR=1 FL=1